MAKKSSKPARKSSDPKPADRRERRIDKESLFEDFFFCASKALALVDLYFGTQVTWATAMGVLEADHNQSELRSDGEQETARETIRNSFAWSSLSALYDYAIDGVALGDSPDDIVLMGADAIRLVTTELYQPADAWERVIAMGDGRFGLDSGDDLTVEKLALLAAVDIRTIRNAISSGELMVAKSEGTNLIKNASARKWLAHRKGFKPTRNLLSADADLGEICSPSELGNFLLSQRTRLGIKLDAQKLLVFHPLVNAKVLNELERGVFQLPLDVVFPLADFYQVDRDALLACVMRSFFKDQLVSLASSIRSE